MATSQTPIYSAYQAIELIFIAIRNSSYGDFQDQPAIEDQIARFRLWAGNIVAHRKGVSSLDHRLRDSKMTRDTVLSLLRTVNESFGHSMFDFGASIMSYVVVSDRT